VRRIFMDRNKRIDLLKDEYVMLQRFYEDIDGKGLTIKNWAITVALATIGAGVFYKNYWLFLIAFGASFVFWYLEAYWRGLSHFFVVRILEIEEMFKTDKADKALPLQVYSKWSEEYDKSKDQTLKYMFRKSWSLALPHVGIAALSLVLFIVGLYGLLW
jgi:hypothetical protein